MLYLLAVLITALAIILFYFVYRNTIGVHNPISERRELKTKGMDGKVLSLKEGIFQELYQESLNVTLRQNEANIKISRGDLSDDVQNEVIKLNHEIERIAEKSVSIGLVRKGAAKLTIV